MTSIGSPTPALSVEGRRAARRKLHRQRRQHRRPSGAIARSPGPAWNPSASASCRPRPRALDVHHAGQRTTVAQRMRPRPSPWHVETATSIMTPGPDAPANLSFAYTPGGPLPPVQTFAVRTPRRHDTLRGGDHRRLARGDSRERHRRPGRGRPQRLRSIPSGLAPGTYTGTILVTIRRHGRPLRNCPRDPDGG